MGQGQNEDMTRYRAAAELQELMLWKGEEEVDRQGLGPAPGDD